MSNNAMAQSPLYHADFSGLAKATECSEAGVTLYERPCLGHLNLRGNAQDSAFVEAVEAALGMPLPIAPCSSSQHSGNYIMWLSPDEWLVVVEGGKEQETEALLREQLNGHFAVSDVSGGQTWLTLSGPESINVLKKSTGYDVHLDHFPVGKVVGTAFAKASCNILRTGEYEFQLIIRRSFADYLWMWLQQCSKEYGLKAEG